MTPWFSKDPAVYRTRGRMEGRPLPRWLRADAGPDPMPRPLALAGGVGGAAAGVVVGLASDPLVAQTLVLGTVAGQVTAQCGWWVVVRRRRSARG